MVKVKKEERRRQENKKYKTLIKNWIKTFNQNIRDNEKGKLAVLTSKIQKFLDKAVNKKIINRNKSNRLKSQIQSNFHRQTKQTMA